MLEIREIGEYSTGDNRIFKIYMVEHQGGIMDGKRHEGPSITYYLDKNGDTELLGWPDWQAFTMEVNHRAGWAILDPREDPAVELGIAVDPGMACPDCGNRVMDFLCPLEGVDMKTLPEGAEEADIICDVCGTFYDIEVKQTKTPRRQVVEKAENTTATEPTEMQEIVLTVVVELEKLNGVLAHLQTDGMVIETITPVILRGKTQALVVFSGTTQYDDPTDLLVWLEEEYEKEVVIY